MTIIQKMVGNVLEKSFEDFDRETVNYAKLRIMDTLGAIIGSTHSSGVDMLSDIVNVWGGVKESTILAIGGKYPAANTAMVMGVMARSNDLEPAGGPEIDGKKSPGHYSATTVPTALAVAEKLGSSGKEMIAAVILGDDLASRIGIAGAGDPDILGWDPACTCSRFGAVSVAGRLIGLTQNQMLNALGIVLHQVAGTMQPVYEYTHSFKLSQGLAAWNGIFSAQLAKRGFSGSKDPLMGRFGYFQQYCGAVDTGILSKDLGGKFYADEEFKVYPCCRGIAGCIESAIKIIKENDVESKKIVEININLPPGMKDSFLVQPFKIGDCAQATAILNLRYNVANVFLRKNVALEHYTEAAIADTAISDLISRITVNFTLPGKRLSSQISVKMDDEKKLSAFTETPRGDWGITRLTKDEIVKKFEVNAKYSKVIGMKKVDTAIALIEKLEELEKIDDIIRALIPV